MQPTYEDTLYYLWVERNLPEGANPKKATLKDDLERRRLAKLLTRGMEKPTGYILPIEFNGAYWQSSLWPMRSDVITLIPGDSPMGYRLPLNSLPPVSEEEIEIERDPFEPREPLPIFRVDSEAPTIATQQETQPQKQPTLKITKNVVRTALCIEPRDGRLYIFLPPVSYLENYVALINAIEAVAAKLKMPVVIEGYEPPKDYRLQKFLITPDPGVT